MSKENEVMDERSELKGFTFFRSYYESSLELPTDKERLSFLIALCEYAFTGNTPNISGPAMALFKMAKPVIDKSIRKAVAGAKGGRNKKSSSIGSKPEANGKQTGSKPEANGKQTESKPEANRKQTESHIGEGKEEESGKEEDEEKDYDANFEDFWAAYPRKQGKIIAKEAFVRVLKNGIDAQVILDAVEKQKKSNEWRSENGKYVPNPSKWLSEGRWEDDLGGSNNDEGNNQEHNVGLGNAILSGIFEKERSGNSSTGEMSAR